MIEIGPNILINEKVALLVVFLLFFVPAIPLLARSVRAGRITALRPIAGFSILRGLITQSLETGRALHLSLGTQGVSDRNTAQTLAGLTTLRYLADQAAVYGATPIVTTADATAMIAAQDVLRNATEDRGTADRFDPRDVRLIGPDSTAYAAGVMGILSREEVLANVMVGALGDEYLLMGETAARKGIEQIVGTANPQTLPFMAVSAGQVLVGEEIFAAGAYLSGIPSHIASLLVQDWMRIAIVVIIIVGVIWKTIG